MDDSLSREHTKTTVCKVDPFDMNSVIDAIISIVDKERLPVYANITGGTNLMAGAALSAAFFVGAKAAATDSSRDSFAPKTGKPSDISSLFGSLFEDHHRTLTTLTLSQGWSAASGGKRCDNNCSALSRLTIPVGAVCVQSPPFLRYLHFRPCLVVMYIT